MAVNSMVINLSLKPRHLSGHGGLLMNLALRIDNNIVAVMVSIIFLINVSSRIDKNDLKIKTFVSMFILNTFVLIVETITCVINHQPYLWLIPITKLLHVISFTAGPVVTYLWFLFVYVWVNDGKLIKRQHNMIILLPLIINSLVVVASPFLKLVYYISADNIYYRGPLFFVPITTSYFYLLLSFIFILVNRKKANKVEFLPLLLFAVFPAAAGLIQSLSYGFLLFWSTIAFALIIIYLYLQQQMLQIDPLTGAWTRDKFKSFLKDRAGQSRRRFAIVFMDLDDFKQVNDTYGHLEGDKALKSVVQIINSSLRTGDFIGRYGGDEFVLYLKAESREEVEAIMARLTKAFDSYNAAQNRPYPLNFSYGYELYDCDVYTDLDEYIKYVDDLMYKAKNDKKNG